MDKVIYIVILLISSILDIKKRIVSNKLCFAIAILSAIMMLQKQKPLDYIPAAFVITVPLLILAIKTDCMGGGDIKFIFCNTLYIGLTGSIYATIFACVLIIITRFKYKKAIPMIPYLSAGYILFIGGQF